MVPNNLRYADSHEWASVEGDVCTVGITKFAVEQLTDVVFVELIKLGKKVAVKDAFGQIESVKSVNDLYAPVGGEIIARNDALEKDPTLVSADPYGNGWMVKIKMSAKADYDKLMPPGDYEKQIASQAH
jgi:glycine cleavage system H protein